MQAPWASCGEEAKAACGCAALERRSPSPLDDGRLCDTSPIFRRHSATRAHAACRTETVFFSRNSVGWCSESTLFPSLHNSLHRALELYFIMFVSKNSHGRAFDSFLSIILFMCLTCLLVRSAARRSAARERTGASRPHTGRLASRHAGQCPVVVRVHAGAPAGDCVWPPHAVYGYSSIRLFIFLRK